MKSEKVNTSFYLDAAVYGILRERCRKLEMSMSTIISHAVVTYLSEKPEDGLEKRYLDVKKKEMKENMINTIRSDNAKRMMIVTNVKKRIRAMLSENDGEDIELALTNVQESIAICILKGWDKEAEKLNDFKQKIIENKSRF